MVDEKNENREIAIAVKNVCKVYKLYDKPMDRLKEALRLTRKAGRVRRDYRDKWFREIHHSKDYHGGAQSLKRKCCCQWTHLCAFGAGGRL